MVMIICHRDVVDYGDDVMMMREGTMMMHVMMMDAMMIIME